MKPLQRSSTAPAVHPGAVLTPSSQAFLSASELRERRWLMGKAGAVAIGILIVCIATTLLLYTTTAPQTKRYGTCNNTDCRAYSRLLRGSINASSHPCSNFYRHVCGNWEKYHAGSVLRELLLEPFMEEVFSSLGSVKVPPGNQSATEKAAQYYQSCESVLDGNVGVPDILHALRSAGLPWPEKKRDGDVLSSMMYTSREMFITSFLHFEVSKQKASTVLRVVPPEWRDFRDKRRRMIESQRYESYYLDMVEEFRSSRSNVVDFKEFYRTEERILKTLPSEAFVGRAESMTFDTFNQNLTPAIEPWRWKKALTKNFRGIDLGAPLLVEVTDAPYVREFNRLFRELPEPDLLMYAGWVTLHRFPDVFRRAFFDSYYYDNTDVARKVQRKRCLSIVEEHMGWATVADAVERRLGQDTRRDLSNMARNILSAVERALNRKTGYNISDSSIFWVRNMYHSTEDLDDIYANYSNMGRYAPGNWIKAKRGYASSYNPATAAMWPKYFHNYFEQRAFDVLGTKPSTALLPDTQQELVIKPHNLAIPMYGTEATFGIKYGAIGSMIARALFVSFKGTDMWNVTSRNCPWVPAGEDRKRAPDILERVASVQLAWDAVGNTIRRSDRRIINLGNYSEAATFFLAHCFLLCNRKDSLNAERLCNEPLVLTKAFADIMGCPQGSPMNPSELC